LAEESVLLKLPTTLSFRILGAESILGVIFDKHAAPLGLCLGE